MRNLSKQEIQEVSGGAVISYAYQRFIDEVPWTNGPFVSPEVNPPISLPAPGVIPYPKPWEPPVVIASHPQTAGF